MRFVHLYGAGKLVYVECRTYIIDIGFVCGVHKYARRTTNTIVRVQSFLHIEKERFVEKLDNLKKETHDGVRNVQRVFAHGCLFCKNFFFSYGKCIDYCRCYFIYTFLNQ